MKVSLSPDIILCGCLDSKQQLTNSRHFQLVSTESFQNLTGWPRFVVRLVEGKVLSGEVLAEADVLRGGGYGRL